MTILITGGAGFIGSHIAAQLLVNDVDFVIVDNLSNSDRQNLNSLQWFFKKEIKFEHFDIREVERMQEVFEDHQVTSVIHCASLKSVGESINQPIHYEKNNVDGSRVLVELAKSFNVQKFIFSSSACVYGEPKYLPIDETHRLSPVSPYGQNKMVIEDMLRKDPYFDSHCRTIIFRYFNPIGSFGDGLIGEIPRGTPNNLMPYILGVVNQDYSHLRIFGNDYQTTDGTAVRDYIHIMDLVDAHIVALQDKTLGLSTFNVGTGNGISVNEIIDSFKAINGVEVPCQVEARRAGDVASCYADNKKIIQQLSWRPNRSLNQMCRDAYLFARTIRMRNDK